MACASALGASYFFLYFSFDATGKHFIQSQLVRVENHHVLCVSMTQTSGSFMEEAGILGKKSLLFF